MDGSLPGLDNKHWGIGKAHAVYCRSTSAQISCRSSCIYLIGVAGPDQFLVLSMLPDWAFHKLALAENPVVFWEVKDGCAQDCKMKYLMTGPTEIKLSRRTALWATYHINNGTLDVDISSQCVYPCCIRRDVFVHEGEHYEHQAAREA